MMTTLLVALAQSAVIAASAGGPPQPAPTVWPIEWMKERCPHFTDTAVPLVTSDIAECQVTEWGEFASFERGTYYYVLYCVVLNENKEEDGACADPSSVSARVHGAANAAVFVREDNSPTVRLVMSHYTGPFGAIFEKPLLVSNAYGAIMQLTMHVPSTCYCNSSGYYIWRKNTRQWQPLDWWGWQQGFDRRLPSGLESQNGFWPDLATMSAAGGLWNKDDPHCCPSGGTVDVQLGITGNRFILKSLKVHRNPPENQERRDSVF
jgi:hypothetical protein